MALNKNRSVERAAVNTFRALMERHNFIVQEVDGGNDHGEDLYVSFTENMKRTGDTIFVQVKGGRSYKTASGYRVPIEDHREYWEKSNAPIFCVVQDLDTHELFWANASAQLREAKRLNKEIKSIKIEKKKILNDETITAFSLRARLYIAETGDLHKFLAKISGVQFDITDYLAYFENLFGEQMIFRQKKGEDAATLLHSDLDWEPIRIAVEDLTFDRPASQFPRKKPGVNIDVSIHSTLRGVILDKDEFMWVKVCFEASRWIRETDSDQETQRRLNVHRIPPVLYSPRQELEVANKAWRNQPEFDVLMEKFIGLGYEYWQDIDEHYDGKRADRKPPRPKDVVWNKLREVMKQLQGLGTPHYYLMSNRGRLTRSELQQVYDLRDYR